MLVHIYLFSSYVVHIYLFSIYIFFSLYIYIYLVLLNVGKFCEFFCDIFLFEGRITFNCRAIISASPISLCSFEMVWFLAQVSCANSAHVCCDFWCWRNNTADDLEGHTKAGELQTSMTLHPTESWLGRKWLQVDSPGPASLNVMGTNVFLHLKG